MKWSQVVAREILDAKSVCRLVFAGESAEGQPLCFEGDFKIHKLGFDKIVMHHASEEPHPLGRMKHIHFVDLSFRERGILHFALVKPESMEIKNNHCTVTLAPPEQLQTYQNRKFVRKTLTEKVGITCRVVGIRNQKTHPGPLFTGRITELSASGLSFLSGVYVFYPLFLEMGFYLPDQDARFTVNGEVVRAARAENALYRIAVEFRNIDDSAMRAIDRFCTTF